MDDERELLKALRVALAGQAPPEEAALMAGLAILRDMDLRASAAALSCPVLMLLGRRDRLIPAAVSPAMSELNRRAEIRVLEGAAHIPFWTHAAATLDAVVDFLARCDCRGSS
jgi:pimeloyl-[acyl-carrier protein] methyl ester esterase